jgi:spore coat polysaccharide biosynthesis protein SpsF
LSALAIVQARMSSERLPGKVLADIQGEPMLALLLRRLERAQRVERIVVATSTEDGDEPVAVLAGELGFRSHRGHRDDVLGRLAEAADGHEGTIVRVTGDCPLIDPGVVDAVIALLERSAGCAYASNVEPRTYPDGLDVEAMPARVLAEVAVEATDPADREHVTAMIRRSPWRWPRAGLEGVGDLAALRWTVDTESDLQFVRALIGRLGDRRYQAGVREIREAALRAPSLADFGGVRRA